jgi:hypothetical protein
MRRLELHFRAVLATFFSRWKAGSQWRCTTRTRSTAHGHCDEERKVIEIKCVSNDDDALDLLLIHEISHAVASPGHSKTWQCRIALAANVARRVGRLRLVELLDAEIARYRERAEPLALAYQEVRDAVLHNPDLTLAQMKRWLGQMYGVRYGDIEKVFRGVRTVYTTARKEALEVRACKERRNGGMGSASTGRSV